MIKCYFYIMLASISDVLMSVIDDCPLSDKAMVGEVISRSNLQLVDGLTNSLPSIYPDGLDLEVFSLAALARVASENQDLFDHEYVTVFSRLPKLFKPAG